MIRPWTTIQTRNLLLVSLLMEYGFTRTTFAEKGLVAYFITIFTNGKGDCMLSRGTVFVWIILLALPAMLIMGCQSRTVFVTEAIYDGLFGGLTAADAICQDEAQEAGLTGTYIAWLSDSVEGPDTRFVQGTVPYALVNGVQIAGSWDGLTDGTLQNPINVTAAGNPVTDYTYVWTNTLPWGEPDNMEGDPRFDSCDDWGTSQLYISGRVGDANRTDNAWTKEDALLECSGNMLSLYCFQD